MAYKAVFSEEIAEVLVELIETHLPGLLDPARCEAPRLIAHLRANALREYPEARALRGVLPAVLVVVQGAKVMPSRVIGPVVEVEEHYRVLVVTASETRDYGSAPQDLSALAEGLARVLAGHGSLPEAEVFGTSTARQLTPLRVEAIEYDPPELRDLQRVMPGAIGAALPLSVRTFTTNGC